METQIDRQRIVSIYGTGSVYVDQSSRRGFVAFFGNKKLSKDLLGKMFSQKKIFVLKQTHSNIVVDADNYSRESQVSIEGDGAYATREDEVLCVQTADCTPMLYLSPKTSRHGFVHAGWRGVANEIWTVFLTKAQADQHLGFVEIGPHILQKNFEVDTDVAKTILNTIHIDPENSPEQPDLFYRKGIKWHLNLSAVLVQQLRQWNKSKQEKIIWNQENAFDVFDRTDYHSYRRDKQNAGRNLSFTMILRESEMQSNPLFSRANE